MPTTDLAIDLTDVAKIYKGSVHALRGIQMQVRRGEIFGLLGPNGAGKSTLVKIMMTVVRPTHADGTVLNRPIGHKGTLAKVGYLPENHRFPRYLTGRQTLEFFGALAKVDRATAKRRSLELLDTVGMGSWANKKIGTYSKGMLQRIGLAQAMMNDPDLILLDEPTDGVDPVGRREIRDVLLRLREQGKSVFINSHLLSELEMICDRVAILVQGQVARQGTVDELTREQQRYEIELLLPDPAASRTKLIAMLKGIGASLAEKSPAVPAPVGGSRPDLRYYQGRAPMMTPGGHFAGPRFAVDAGTFNGAWLELEGPLIRLGAADPKSIEPILDACRSAGLTILRLTPVRQTLEDLFMQAVIDPASGRAYAPGAAVQAGRPPVAPPPIPQGRVQ
jgi:ABC-2 type transport system ATP-binding protein